MSSNQMVERLSGSLWMITKPGGYTHINQLGRVYRDKDMALRHRDFDEVVVELRLADETSAPPTVYASLFHPNQLQALIQALPIRDGYTQWGHLHGMITRWLQTGDPNTVTMRPEEPARELTLLDFGYAPGNYTFKCLDCGQEGVGDKRASRCETCATQALRENRRGAVKASAPFCNCVGGECHGPNEASRWGHRCRADACANSNQ